MENEISPFSWWVSVNPDNITSWFLQSERLRGIQNEVFNTHQLSKITLCLDKPRCPVCYNTSLYYYHDTIVVCDVESGYKTIGYKDWGCTYSAYECQDCGWENI